MKKVFKHTVALVLCAALAAGVSAQAGEGSVSAAEKKTVANKLALKKMKKGIGSSQIRFTTEGIATGSKAKRAKQMKEAADLPSKFDLRDVDGKNYVTSVKLQNPWTSCWSFAVVAASETSLLYENGVTNEEFKAANGGKELNFSEKALAWFSSHAITKADVMPGSIPASQVGEGMDVSELEKNNKNVSYNNGGLVFLGASLFSAGIGPKTEYQRFEGEENEYPYAYRGKNGWTNYDVYVGAGAEEAKPLIMLDWRQQVLKAMATQGIVNPTEEKIQKGTEMYYDYTLQAEMAKGSGDGEPYSKFDDWTMPIDYAHRVGANEAMLQESSILPNPSTDRENFIASAKKELNAGRAISFAYSAQSSPDESGYLSDKWAQYVYKEGERINHGVTIVGYDDNYSRANFEQGTDPETGDSKTPPADGAFIVKNSWGSVNDESEGHHNTMNWGVDGSGYFYLSYYDKSIAVPETFNYYSNKEVAELVDVKNRSYIINQYDLMPASQLFHMYDEKKSSMANIFTADMDQKLTRITVATGAFGGETTYEVYRLNDGYKNPRDGVLLEKKNTSFEYGGYHTIPLDKQYPIAKGTSFSVVVTNKATIDGKQYYDIQANESSHSATAFSGGSYTVKGVVNRGESMICHDGSWIDWADASDLAKDAIKGIEGEEYELDNFGIKVYAIPPSASEVRTANTIKLDGKNITKKAQTIKVKSTAVTEKAQSYKVTRNGKGKITLNNKSAKAFKKYLSLKSGKVVLKKNAPAGTYKFTLTVAASGEWKKTTSKPVSIVVK